MTDLLRSVGYLLLVVAAVLAFVLPFAIAIWLNIKDKK